MDVLTWLASFDPKPTGGGSYPPREIAAGGDRAGRGALASECERVASAVPGERDAVLNTAAYRMGQLVGAGHLELAVVVEELTAAGLACGQTEAEVARALRTDTTGGLTKGQGNPRYLEPRESGPAPLTVWSPPAGGPPPDPAEVGRLVDEAWPEVDWRAAWEDESEEEWLLEPLIPARRLVALYSPPKVGKSLLALEIAAGLATCRDVLGFRPAKPIRVLYVDFENDVRGDVIPRLKAYGYGPEELVGWLRYQSFPSLHALDTPAGGDELLALAQEREAELVIIDTISRAISGEENANDTWLSFYRNCGAKLKANGIACLRLDHSGKDVERGMRGGSAKYSDVDAVWQLSEVEPERTFKLLCTDNRFPIAEKELIVRRMTVPRLLHRVDPEGSFGVYRDKLAATVAKLDELEVDLGASVRSAADALREVDAGARQSIVASALKLRRTRAGEEEDS